ncbi:hypothetical protein ACF1BQ_032460 [Bradyrhizobium sp. RDT10]
MPLPISSIPSLAGTLKSTRFPSTLITSAVAHTSWPTGRGGEGLYVYCSADPAFDEARENQIFVRPALAV